MKYKTDEAFWALLRKSSAYKAAGMDIMKGKPSDQASIMERGMDLYLDGWEMNEDAWGIFFKLNPKAKRGMEFVANRDKKIVTEEAA